MGFFKNLGKTIKKASKQISFKNVVKIASGFDPTGIIGGMVAADEAKKQQRAEEAQALQQEASAKVSQITGTLGGNFVKDVISDTYNQTSQSAKDAVALVGAKTGDTVITAWLKLHWKQLVIGVSALVTIVLLYKRFGGHKPAYKSYRR